MIICILVSVGSIISCNVLFSLLINDIYIIYDSSSPVIFLYVVAALLFVPICFYESMNGMVPSMTLYMQLQLARSPPFSNLHGIVSVKCQS
jgi:hypothetical protein